MSAPAPPARAPQRPILCLVTDPELGGPDLVARVAAARRGGVDWVQLRDRRASAGELLAQLDALRAAAPAGGLWLVNRRVDVAWAGGADGVHLGFDGLPAGEVRRLLGAGACLGVATHADDELARGGLRAELDYAHLAPIFAPLSKASSRPPLGLEALRRASRQGIPILAQGGVEAGNARACLEAGAVGVAVTGAILASDDPEAAARVLREALGEAWTEPDTTAGGGA